MAISIPIANESYEGDWTNKGKREHVHQHNGRIRIVFWGGVRVDSFCHLTAGQVETEVGLTLNEACLKNETEHDKSRE
jgi:hypothetical protein